MSQGIQVMIVEDNAQVAEAIQIYFEKKNLIRVTGIAFNALEAIELLKTTSPDVIILDLVMPRSDGFVLLEYLNTTGYGKKPEVIVLSALSNEAIIRRACDLGAIYYILKPFSMQGLYDRVQDICGVKSSSPVQPVLSKNEISLDQRISTILMTIGIPTQNKGYKYLCQALKLVNGKPDLINSMTKKLYPIIGESFSTNPVNVEHAIHHAIEVAWDSEKLKHINQSFKGSLPPLQYKPTNGEFISIISTLLKIH